MSLAVALAVLAMAAPAQAGPAAAPPVSAHAMVHTCCMPLAVKERIFSEAKAVGANYIRVDVELAGIYLAPDALPDFTELDAVLELSQEHELPVVGILMAPPSGAAPGDFARMAGEIAEHAAGTVRHWQIYSEADGKWSFPGTPEEYARVLAAAHDSIKARVPEATIVLSGVASPHQPQWLNRVFATPGADAVHKFDVASVHLRGRVAAVSHRYRAFRDVLAGHGFSGPLWVTEHGYSADPAFQNDPLFDGGAAAQAAYLTETVVDLGEAGAEQVFVTLRDNLWGPYAAEGLVNIAEPAGTPVSRRPSFSAMRRVVERWDDLMAWRVQQRRHEQALRAHEAAASLAAGDARIAAQKLRGARRRARGLRVAIGRAPDKSLRERLGRRLRRARAELAGRRTALMWSAALTRWHRDRAGEQAAAAAALGQRVAWAD